MRPQAERGPTVVSVTPLNLEADSRTFKQAASMARLGYRSIVFEGIPSARLPADLPFEVVSFRDGPAAPESPKLPDEAEIDGLLAQADAAQAEPEESIPAPAVGMAASGAAHSAAADPEPPAAGKDPRGPVERGLDALARTLPPSVRRGLGPAWRPALAWLMRTYVRIRYVSLASLLPVGPVLAIRRYVRRTRAMADQLPEASLYYLHAPYQFPAVWAGCRRHGVSFIYDAHDLYSVLHKDGRRFSRTDRAILGFYGVLERLCVRQASACVTVGQGVGVLASRRFGRRFAVVRNAHDTRLDSQHSAESLRGRLGLGAGDLLMVVSGNRKPTGMAVEALLDALANLPAHVHAAFLGRGYEDLARKAVDGALAGRVHFPAPVAPTEVVPLIASADLAPILYFPATANLRNALPNGFFHAVGAGLPVLYPYRLPELRHLCEVHDLGWPIDPQRPATIVAAVENVLTRPAALTAAGERVAAAREELSWSREEDRLAELVAECLRAGAA